MLGFGSINRELIMGLLYPNVMRSGKALDAVIALRLRDAAGALFAQRSCDRMVQVTPGQPSYTRTV